MGLCHVLGSVLNGAAAHTFPRPVSGFFGGGLRLWFASRSARDTLRAPCPRSGYVQRARQVPRRRQELVTLGRQHGRSLPGRVGLSFIFPNWALWSSCLSLES